MWPKTFAYLFLEKLLFYLSTKCFFYVSLNLSIHLSTNLYFFIPAYLFILSLCLSIYLSINICLYLPIYLSMKRENCTKLVIQCTFDIKLLNYIFKRVGWKCISVWTWELLGWAYKRFYNRETILFTRISPLAESSPNLSWLAGILELKEKC